MKKTLFAGVTAGLMLLGTAAPALAGHEHFVRITNPSTGEITCQFVARGSTARHHQFHENVHASGPGARHGADDVVDVDKEGHLGNQGCLGANATIRGRQTDVVE